MRNSQQNHRQKFVETTSLRERAEEKAKTMELPLLSDQNPEAILIHELQVHQIELEMQNEELRTIQNQIEIERFRYFDLYDLAPVGYSTISEKGIILQANLTLAKILIVDRRAMIKKPFSAFIFREDEDIYYMFLKKLLKTNNPQTCELRMVKNDKITLWCSLHATVNQDEEDTKGLRVTISDITVQKILEMELRNAELAAQKANRAKSVFLANMNHELRTPLNGIIGFCDILRETSLNDQQKEYLDIVYNSGRHLTDIVTDILDFSQIEAGKFELNPKKTQLKELVENTLSIIRPKAEKKGLTLRISVEHDIPQSVEVDASRLRQVLLNLVYNAVKFTDAGSVQISVSLQERHSDKVSLLFKVIDTGIGIKEDEQAKIFEPFQQANMLISKKAEGTGLGLAISRQIVTLMGGNLQLKSLYGKGSEFFFELLLPCVLKEAIDMDNIESEKTDEPLFFKNKKILVAEDNPINIFYVQTVISMVSKDIQVIKAANGKEAYNLYREQQPDLIFMDIRMPELDGYQATAMIRRHDAQIPIIAMTAMALKEDKEEGLSIGMNDYITKPISLEKLKETLKKYLH